MVFKAFPLDHRIYEFGVAGGQLKAANIQVPLFRHAAFGSVLAGQRGGFYGEVPHKDWAVELVGAEFFPNFFDEFAVTPATILGNLDPHDVGKRFEFFDGGIHGDLGLTGVFAL